MKIHLISDIHNDQHDQYGSYFWGGHEPGVSDIDASVLVARIDGERLNGAEKHEARISLPSGLYVGDIYKIERYRNLTHTMPGKLLARGIVLYENEDTAVVREQARCAALPYLEARVEWVATWREREADMLRRANESASLPKPLRNLLALRIASNSQCACVFALWSVLYANDSDASNKAIRWDCGKLLTIASVLYPNSSPLSGARRGWR